MGVRVQQILQRAGLTSRRGAEDWIRAGRVQINGQVAKLGDTCNLATDQVTVDGKLVEVSTRPSVTVALHKPAGYTTSLKDRHAAHLVTELLPKKFGRLFPIGRLDRDSEGLLLFTNDGQLAHALMHPSSRISKVYEVWVKGVPKHSHLERMKRGIVLEDGVAKPDELRIIRKENSQSVLKVTLHEGRKREIRRLFESIGHPVQRLVRVQYGPIRLKDIAPGQARPLTHREVQALWSEVRHKTEGNGKRHEAVSPSTTSSRKISRVGRGVSSAGTRHPIGHPRGDSRRTHR